MSLDRNHPLIQAILVGDTDAVRAMDFQPEWVHEKLFLRSDERWALRTPLIIAAGCYKGNADIVRFLLEKGSDVHFQADYLGSALAAAVEGVFNFQIDESIDKESEEALLAGGDLERIQALVEAGADINETFKNSGTLVSLAARRGKADWLRYLLKQGAKLYPEERALPKIKDYGPELDFLSEWEEATANPDIATTNYQFWMMPLHCAAESGSVECCQVLLDFGVPVDFPDQSGGPALARASTPEVARFLIQKGANKDGPAGRLSNIVEEHLCEGRYDVARCLLEAGAKQGRSNWGQNMAHGFAGIHMDPVALKLLVEFGADLSEPDHNNGTILHNACWQGDGNAGRAYKATQEAIQYLIDQGIPVNAKNKFGVTALHEAVYGDWESPIATRLLLEHGADVDAVDDHGQTALMLAADHGAESCIEILLQHGANPHLKDGEGQTALDCATKYLETWRNIASQSGSDEDHERWQGALEEAERSFELIRKAT